MIIILYRFIILKFLYVFVQIIMLNRFYQYMGVVVIIVITIIIDIIVIFIVSFDILAFGNYE